MTALANPSFQQTLAFLEDVKTKVGDKGYKDLYKILMKAKTTLSDGDLARVIGILKHKKNLMLQFNMFIKGDFSYWSDPDGHSHLLFKDEKNTISCYGEKPGQEGQTASKMDIVSTTLQFSQKYLEKLDDDSREHVEAVIRGDKTTLEDLDEAVDMITDFLRHDDTESAVLMFGRLIPNGSNGSPGLFVASVWMQMHTRLRGWQVKQVALWSADCHKWNFYKISTNNKREADWHPEHEQPVKIESN